MRFQDQITLIFLLTLYGLSSLSASSCNDTRVNIGIKEALSYLSLSTSLDVPTRQSLKGIKTKGNRPIVTVIVSLIDKNYAEFIRPWLQRIRSFYYNLGTIVDGRIVIPMLESMDFYSFNECRNQSVPVICTYMHQCHNDSDRKKVWNTKNWMLHSIIDSGYDLLFMDIDIIMQKNIVVGIESLPNFSTLDIIIAGHSYSNDVNSGFFYAKSNNRTNLFFKHSYHAFIKENKGVWQPRNSPLFNYHGSDQSCFDSLLGNNYNHVPQIASSIGLTFKKLTIQNATLYTEWSRKGAEQDGHWGYNLTTDKFFTLHLTNMPLDRKKFKLRLFYGIQQPRNGIPSRNASRNGVIHYRPLKTTKVQI
jgi:hypothetical protein